MPLRGALFHTMPLRGRTNVGNNWNDEYFIMIFIKIFIFHVPQIENKYHNYYVRELGGTPYHFLLEKQNNMAANGDSVET